MNFNQQEQLANIDKDIEVLKAKKKMIQEALAGFETLRLKLEDTQEELNHLNGMKRSIESNISFQQNKESFRSSFGTNSCASLSL